MTLSNELNAGVDAAIAELAAMGDAEAAQAGPKPKAKKTKAAPKAKAKTAAEVKAEAEAPKPEPKTLDGFELKEGADADAIKSATKDAQEAIEAINRKDADLLQSYLSLGAFNSQAAKAFKSTKLMGQYIAKNIPASASLDPALRSNCKWLHEALNDPEHEAFGSLLGTLGVNRIEDYKSGNPTVIRRDFSAKLKEAEAKEKAEALGIEADDPVKALADKAKAEAKERFAEDLADAVAFLTSQIASTGLTKADIAHSVAGLVETLSGRKGDDYLSAINTFKVVKAPKD